MLAPLPEMLLQPSCATWVPPPCVPQTSGGCLALLEMFPCCFHLFLLDEAISEPVAFILVSRVWPVPEPEQVLNTRCMKD